MPLPIPDPRTAPTRALPRLNPPMRWTAPVGSFVAEYWRDIIDAAFDGEVQP